MLFFEPPNLFERFFQKFSGPFFSSALRSIRVAKVRTYFRSSKSFFEDFSEFCQNLFCVARIGFSIEAGAKVRTFSESANLFLKIFQNFSEPVFAASGGVSLSKRVQR